MFLNTSKTKKVKERKKLDLLLRKGLSYQESSFYNKAMYEFQQALDIDPEYTCSILSIQLDKNLEEDRNEIALSLGLIILKNRTDDYKLANTLGNCARRLKRYKQANSLYRQAFRINRNYDIALYNLAASMGRVPKFNKDVKTLVDRFAYTKNYVLPRYRNDPEFENKIVYSLRERMQDDQTEFEDELKDEMEGMPADYRSDVEKFLSYRAAMTKQISGEPTYSDICMEMKKEIQHVADDLSTKEGLAKFEDMVFNLGLFALSRRNSSLALKCFFQLKNRKSKIEHLDMVITLAMDIEKPSEKIIQHMMVLLGKEKTNRFLNVNLGLMFKKQKNRILSYKYLATGALLLDKTNNVYCHSELIEMADRELELGELKKAFQLYQMVDSEIDNIHVMANIAQIYLYENRHAEAIPVYQKILGIDSSLQLVQHKLQEIHDYYLSNGDKLFAERKYSSSASYYQKALRASRHPETIRKTAGVYRLLKNKETAKKLMEEYNQAMVEHRADNREQTRVGYIEKGKEYLSKKEFQKALEYFEKALPMRVDKDVFVYLAHILKRLNRTRELENLMIQWNEMLRREGIN